MANILIYIDYSATSNGTGSIISPYNTISGLPTQQNRTYLLKSGTTITDDLGPLLNGDGNVIGAYGTGEKPIIDRSLPITNMTYNNTYDIYEKALGTGAFGHVTEDGIPLKAIYWNAVNDIATVAPLMTAGTFAFDNTNQIVYVKPSSGSIDDHSYRYASGLYCIRTTNSNSNLKILDLDITGASRHGIALFNKKGLLISNIGGGKIGGYWEGTRAAYIGNGIEISAGCLGAQIVDCVQEDVWDSCFTTQLYEASPATVYGHEYRNVVANRFGLAGVEISNPTASTYQTIRDIYVTNATITNGSSSFWMNKPSGDAVSAVSTLSNGVTNRVDGVVFNHITASNVGRLWSTSNTQGKNVLMNATGDGVYQYGLRKVHAGGGLATATDTVVNCVLTNSAANSEAGGTFTFQDYFRQVRTII